MSGPDGADPRRGAVGGACEAGARSRARRGHPRAAAAAAALVGEPIDSWMSVRRLFVPHCAVLGAAIGVSCCSSRILEPGSPPSPLRREILYGLSRVFYAASAASW